MRNLLRRIAAITALSLALGAVAAGNTLSAPQVTVTALPTTVSVQIALTVDRPLAALGFSLEFNVDYLETTTAQVTPVAARFASATPPVSIDVVAGRITWSAADFTGETVILAGGGPLVSVQFTVKAALAGAPGQSAILHLTGVREVYDTNLSGVTIGTVQNGSVGYDSVPPTVTLNQAAGQADPTNGSPEGSRPTVRRPLFRPEH